MSAFKEWWNGPNSPARRLPQSTADQVEFIAKAAWLAAAVHTDTLWFVKREKKEGEFRF